MEKEQHKKNSKQNRKNNKEKTLQTQRRDAEKLDLSFLRRKAQRFVRSEAGRVNSQPDNQSQTTTDISSER